MPALEIPLVRHGALESDVLHDPQVMPSCQDTGTAVAGV